MYVIAPLVCTNCLIENYYYFNLYTVGPRIACKFVPKNHRVIRNRAVWDYYLLVSDLNEFKNRAIARNFTIKSHYLRNFSEEYIFLLWKSHYCEEFTLFEYLFCFSNRAISRNSHYLNIFGPKIKSRYSEFTLFEYHAIRGLAV